jgi:hypothetical protein
MIAYTIGNTKNYNQSLKENPPETCLKVGRGEGYQGGWVWLTKEEAQSFIDSEDFLKVVWGDGKPRNPKDFQPYGLRLVNDFDDIVKENNQYFLLKDSQFFAL